MDLAQIHRQFLSEILQDRSVQVENPLPGTWEVKGQRWGLRATNEWGTERRPATDIAQAVMEQRRIEVTDEVEGPDGKARRVLNPVETTAAQEKADALQDRFSQWVWEDPERANQLGEVYNRQFNSIRLRDYSQAGDYLTLPGLAKTLELRDHQRAAVARMIAEPAVGLFHQVGAGKTAGDGRSARSELRRHGTDQQARHRRAQPHARAVHPRVAAALPAGTRPRRVSDDLSGDKRRLFVARAAANDWDGIIITQSAFETHRPVQRCSSRPTCNARSTSCAARSTSVKEDGGLSSNAIEKRCMQAEERYKKPLAITARPGHQLRGHRHRLPRRRRGAHVQEPRHRLQHPGRRDRGQRAGLRPAHEARVLCATATATGSPPSPPPRPIANCITEAYVMQRYLRPDLPATPAITRLRRLGGHLRSQTVTEMEMAPAGGGIPAEDPLRALPERPRDAHACGTSSPT